MTYYLSSLWKIHLQVYFFHNRIRFGNASQQFIETSTSTTQKSSYATNSIQTDINATTNSIRTNIHATKSWCYIVPCSLTKSQKIVLKTISKESKEQTHHCYEDFLIHYIIQNCPYFAKQSFFQDEVSKFKKNNTQSSLNH